MAEFDFKPSAVAGMFETLATRLDESRATIVRPDVRQYVQALEANLQSHRASWIKLETARIALSPALVQQYRTFYGDLEKAVVITEPSKARRKKIFDVLENSHQFLIALPDYPVVVPPRPKGPPK